MSLDFPWGLFAVAQEQKRKQQQQQNQDIIGIGTGLGSIGTAFGQIGKNIGDEKAKKTIADYLEAVRNQSMGMPGQQTATAGVDETMMKMPTEPPPMPKGVMDALVRLNPALSEKMLAGNFDPLIRSEIYKNMKAGEGDIMYGTEAGEAALSGNIKKFSELTGNKPISHKTLGIMSSGLGREGLAERQKAYLDQRRDNAVLKYSEDLEKNPILLKFKEQGIGADQVKNLVDIARTGNTVASAGIGIKMAKTLGETGQMSGQDVVRYVQTNKLTQAAGDKLLKWFKGVPTEATLGEIEEIASVIQDSLESKTQPIYDRYVHRLAKNFGMTNEEAAGLLDVPYFGGKSQLGANPVTAGSGDWSYVGPAR